MVLYRQGPIAESRYWSVPCLWICEQCQLWRLLHCRVVDTREADRDHSVCPWSVEGFLGRLCWTMGSAECTASSTVCHSCCLNTTRESHAPVTHDKTWNQQTAGSDVTAFWISRLYDIFISDWHLDIGWYSYASSQSCLVMYRPKDAMGSLGPTVVRIRVLMLQTITRRRIAFVNVTVIWNVSPFEYCARSRWRIRERQRRVTRRRELSTLVISTHLWTKDFSTKSSHAYCRSIVCRFANVRACACTPVC